MDAADLSDDGMAATLRNDSFGRGIHAAKVATIANSCQPAFAIFADASRLRLSQIGQMSYAPFTAEWLRDHLKSSRRKAVDLVRFLNERGIEIDSAKVSKIMRYQREVQRAEMAPIWEFFGLPPEELPSALGLKDSPTPSLKLAPAPNAGLPEPIGFDRERLPIYGSAVGGSGGRLLFNGQRLNSIPRPHSLSGVADAYGAFVHGTSMEPRYEAGEVVLVNPHKGYRREDYVLAQVYDNDQDPPFGYVKRFVSFDDKELVLEQLNPPEGEDRIMRFPRNRVLSVHRIVGTLDE